MTDTILQTGEPAPRKTIPEISIEAEALFKAIIKLEPNQLITYEDLTKIIGRDILDARNFLLTARNKARRENDFVYGIVRKQGLKRLSDAAISGTWRGSVSSIRRRARRTINDLRCAKRDKLSETDRHSLDTGMTISALLSSGSKSKSIAKIENLCKETDGALPLQRTLEAFKTK